MKKIVCILCTMWMLFATVPVMAQTALPDTAGLTSTDFAALFNSICDAWPADLSGGSIRVTAKATSVNDEDGSCTLGGIANSAGEPLDEIILEISNENGEYAAMSEINYICALTACFCEGDTVEERWTAARTLIDVNEALLPGRNFDDRIAYSTLIAALSSTRNKDRKRDPDAHQIKKGNEWHSGYKARIGTGQDSCPISRQLSYSSRRRNSRQFSAS